MPSGRKTRKRRCGSSYQVLKIFLVSHLRIPKMYDKISKVLEFHLWKEQGNDKLVDFAVLIKKLGRTCAFKN